jgi:hypothetical protein
LEDVNMDKAHNAFKELIAAIAEVVMSDEKYKKMEGIKND